MNMNETVRIYTELRKVRSVADAASETMSQCSIAPSLLVDAFNAAQLDLSRTNQEATVIHEHRNELLSHFNAQK